MLSIQSEPWMKRSACQGMDADMFFPERGASVQDAKEVCRSCPVRINCLEYAVTNHIGHGIWGGTSERERRRMRRGRAS